MTEEGLNLGWLQVATAAGFGGLAWYLIAVAIPKGFSIFREELAAERAARGAQNLAFLEAIRREREAYEADLERIAATFRRESEDHRALTREMLDRLEGARPRREEKKGG